ncbi:MAG: guanine deaminase [Burkholderiales bacterium]|nr:guanine deaminase [Burkholderiales bacterium]MCH2240882.1 guanine deaminase [Aquabacterium sp.]
MPKPPPQATPSRFALLADLLDFTDDPGFASPHQAPGVRFRPNHWLLVDGGRIVGTQVSADLPDDSWARFEAPGSLVMPGFIDSHVHSPQLDVIASFGTELLDWLNTYTFPSETRYADPQWAIEGATRFLDALLAHGTTTAVVMPTVHKRAAEALFAQACQRNMRLITGKVLMDRHAPDGLRDDVTQAQKDCCELIERWHGTDRLSYAVTVRFAPTSTPEQLQMAGRLLQRYPGLYMHTHVAENRDEVRWAQELFPEARSYLDIYHRAGLLNERGVLAHGIWLDDEDRALLRDTGAQIAHSPSSNLFLGSGLFDWAAAERAGVRVSVASDVGGGTSLSLLRTLADAYKVQALQGTRLTAWKALYGVTLGAARNLGLDHEIGSLSEGRVADFALWDLAVGPVAARRLYVARDVHERVFAFLTLGDERNLVRTFVAGKCLYQR